MAIGIQTNLKCAPGRQHERCCQDGHQAREDTDRAFVGCMPGIAVVCVMSNPLADTQCEYDQAGKCNTAS